MENKIEIPFGAKDSELKGWEYTIPEGMEAVIKDGKIIVREKESQDEMMCRAALEGIEYLEHELYWDAIGDIDILDVKEYLEKQKEQKPKMIQWTGKNLKEVIDFTGKSPRFDEWFKSWEEYENYVHSHNNILKLFCEDGSHYEVPVGSWIVKTPDGFNIPSLFKFVQKPAEWSEEDEEMLEDIKFSFAYNKGEMTDALIAQYNRFFDKIKSLKPQPKQEWSEGEIKVLDSIIDDYKKGDKSFCGYAGKIVLLNKIREGKYNLSKQKWSEEDKRILKGIIGLVDHDQHYGVSNNEMLTWLKSLPESFNLPSKVEWSEEDEKIRKTLLDYYEKTLDNYTCVEWLNGITYGELCDWFKSLGPRPITYALDAPLCYDIDLNPVYPPINHWKPSEEQMKALKDVIDRALLTCRQQVPLESLLNELRKLI